MPSNMLVFMQGWTRATLRDPLQHFRKRMVRECPVCDYRGYFIAAGPREEVRCPNCSSKERDRTFQLFLNKSQLSMEGKRILHFSPERPFWRKWRRLPGYVSGDVKKNKVANSFVDITHIDFPDEEFDVLICNQILEHVIEDRKGMAECYRVLKRGGIAFFSVPINETATETFEPPASMSKKEVESICGWDHKRLYALDFVDRLKSIGFNVEQMTFTPDEADRYRLKSDIVRGVSKDRIFIARK